jgi:hypothetical protein
MIRASADSGRIILLGLSRANVEKLIAGNPVYVTGESLGAPNITSISVFFGETEADMEKLMLEAGYIGPHTTVIKDIRHGKHS